MDIQNLKGKFFIGFEDNEQVKVQILELTVYQNSEAEADYYSRQVTRSRRGNRTDFVAKIKKPGYQETVTGIVTDEEIFKSNNNNFSFSISKRGTENLLFLENQKLNKIIKDIKKKKNKLHGMILLYHLKKEC